MSRVIGPDVETPVKDAALAPALRALATPFQVGPDSPTMSAWMEAMQRVAGEAEAWPYGLAPVLERAFALLKKGACEPMDALIKEYRRLFVGPAHLEASPWGSVYTDRENVMFGATTLELRAWMRKHGIARTTDAHDPDDHVGTLLALAAWLAENRPELFDELLGEHLCPWVYRYLDLLETAARSGLYRGLAQLTRETLSSVCDERHIEVRKLQLYR